MSIVTKFREYAARRAQERKYYDELAQMSDAELDDLGLSHAKIVEMSRAYSSGNARSSGDTKKSWKKPPARS